jgi:hypothetical protein
MNATFPIDAVYTWVDGNDPTFIARRNQFVTENDKPSVADNRWANHDELRYSLRSLAAYAPWVRKIYIVTNGQIPAWLKLTETRVEIVTHAQIFLWPQDLPTFNSRAIEAHLHRIHGLAKHFLYFNDDTFLGSPLLPSDFFSSDGRPKVIASKHPLPSTYTPGKDALTVAGIVNACRLLRACGAAQFANYSGHQVRPCTIGLCQHIDRAFASMVRGNSAARFRSASDTAIYLAFMGNYALYKKRAVASSLRHAMFRITKDPKNNVDIIDRMRARREQLFCLNDASCNGEVGVADVMRFVKSLFTNPSPWELP